LVRRDWSKSVTIPLRRPKNDRELLCFDGPEPTENDFASKEKSSRAAGRETEHCRSEPAFCALFLGGVAFHFVRWHPQLLSFLSGLTL
jgi:hypothetical protein